MQSDDASPEGRPEGNSERPVRPGRSIPDVKVLGAIFASVLVLVSVVGIVRANRRAARHADATARVESMAEALASVDHRREPLTGGGTEGRAWSDYDGVFEQLLSMDLDDLDRSKACIAVEEAVAGTASDRAEIAKRFRETLSSQWDQLGRGAHCLDAAPPSDLRAISTIPVARKLSDFRVVLSTLTLDGLSLLERGDGAQGAQRILTAMQVAEDFTRSPSLITQMIGLSGLSPHVLLDYAKVQGLGGLDAEGLSQVFDGTERLLGRCASDVFKPSMLGDVVGLWHFGESLGVRDEGTVIGSMEVTEHVRFCDEYLRDQASHDLYEIYVHGQSVAKEEGAESARAKFASAHASAASSYRHNVVQLGLLRIALARALAPLEEADPRLQSIAEGSDFVDPFGGTLEIGHDEGLTVFRVRSDDDSLPVVELRVREG